MPAPECGKRRKDCFQLEGILYFSPEERPEIDILVVCTTYKGYIKMII